MDVLTTSGGDYLGRLMFANSGLQKYSFANLKFQTLWERSSEEGKYVMSLLDIVFIYGLYATYTVFIIFIINIIYGIMVR
jgi:hypothetical protein